MFHLYDVMTSGAALHALQNDVLSTIFGGRGKLSVEAKILKGCR